MDTRLDKLSNSIEALINMIDDLKQRNIQLEAKNETLEEETLNLRNNNQQARTKLESIISRLRQNGENI